MKIWMMMVATFAALNCFAESKAKKHSHGHGAHVHGHAELSIAFDGAKGKVELKAPGDSVYGFEHEAKTAVQKAKVADAFAKLEKKIGEMVQFDAVLKCQLQKESIDIQREADEPNHSEVRASFNVTCEKSPQGTTLRFFMRKHFSRLSDVEVTVLVDSLQKSLDVEKDGVSLDLK